MARSNWLPLTLGYRRIAAVGLIVTVLAVLSSGGCASSKMTVLREVPRSPLVDRFKLTSRKGPQASERTKQLLRVNDLTGDVGHDPNALLTKVQAIIEQDPTPEKVYAFAELAFLEAKRVEHRDSRLALDLYGSSAVHAYQYLFDERFRPTRNPYDPGFRGACDLYNGALESALRIVCDETGLLPGQTYTINTASGSWDITCRIQGGNWRAEDFDRFEFVSDYEIKGLKNHYQAYGLGVPLIAIRRNYPGEPPAAKYYPPGLSFPVTAFLRPIPSGDQDRCDAAARHQAILELYDPLTVVDTQVADLFVPLESDLSTPMARFLSNTTFEQLATAGLLRPEKLLALRPGQPDPIMGLYMMQPYEEGKIPVLFVHGLWSSPMTWMEMYNDLTSSRAVRNRYQFWFYLYPTAQPFWETAAELREDLAEAREVLDPDHREPSLDQMVLVGHSMGGLLSRLQTIDSRDDFWRIVSDQPFSRVQADSEVLQRLEKSLFFRPNPSIRRVITIATPHRGSEFSNDATRWLSAKLIRLPNLLTAGLDVFRRDNRELIRDDRLLNIKNSIDSLAPNSPFFPVMLAAYRAPRVKYHNIVGLVPEGGLTGFLAAGSDGVVSYESAHLDDVQSEIVVRANHSGAHAHPRAVLEVRRILLEHLAELDAGSLDPSTEVRTAAGWSGRETTPQQ